MFNIARIGIEEGATLVFTNNEITALTTPDASEKDISMKTTKFGHTSLDVSMIDMLRLYLRCSSLN
jgi:hypothetical protein